MSKPNPSQEIVFTAPSYTELDRCVERWERKHPLHTLRTTSIVQQGKYLLKGRYRPVERVIAEETKDEELEEFLIF